jgi:hypothetical protein
MKVIDIMQKVANKEIFKFRIDDINYYVDKSNYICEEDGTRVEWYIDDEWLNMNAEIIEEDKKIEKIKNINCESFRDNHNDIRELTDVEIALDIITLKEWINKIIDKLNEEE